MERRTRYLVWWTILAAVTGGANAPLLLYPPDAVATWLTAVQAVMAAASLALVLWSATHDL